MNDQAKVHASHLVVELDPIPNEPDRDILQEDPGAIVIKDPETGAEIRFNLGQCVCLINALTEIWRVSYYG